MSVKIRRIFIPSNTNEKRKKMKISELITENGNTILNVALYNKLSMINDSAYASICGGYIEGAQQWATHNIDFFNTVSNNKYTGYEVKFNNSENMHRLVVPNWVLKIETNDWKHAKNLFNKYLRVV